MKKIASTILAFSLCLSLGACDSFTNETPSATTAPPEVESSVPPTDDVDNPDDADLSPEEQIDVSLRSIVEEHYSSTEISDLMINENLGTDEESDFIALVYLTWDVKNKADTTKQMLAMYSEDLAARVGTDVLDVSELTVFWTVPYYSETDTAVKYTYGRVEGGMVQTDSMISNILN